MHKTFMTEIEKGGPNNSDFLQNWFSLEISPAPLSPLINLYKLENADKSTLQGGRTYLNVMNEDEFYYMKVLKLK